MKKKGERVTPEVTFHHDEFPAIVKRFVRKDKGNGISLRKTNQIHIHAKESKSSAHAGILSFSSRTDI